MEEIPQESNILFHISNDQVDLLAKHFGYDTDDISKMEELPDGQGFNFTEIEDPKEWESVNKAFNESLEMLGGVSK